MVASPVETGIGKSWNNNFLFKYFKVSSVRTFIYRVIDDFDISACLLDFDQMENQTKMVGKDLNRQYKLADETAGGDTPEKVEDDTNEYTFYYCCKL